MILTAEDVEQRIQHGWEKYPTPRPYISLRKETYVKLKAPAIFLDAEYGEWTAGADGVMRGGSHPRRHSKDYSRLSISKEDLYALYIEQNLSLKEICNILNCQKFKLQSRLREIGLKKPMSLKNKIRATTCLERYGYEHPTQNPDVAKRASESRDTTHFNERYRNTVLERYGVDHVLQHADTRAKREATMLQRYGKVHALQVEECKEKFVTTIREKYNDNTLEWSGYAVGEVREKITQTNKERLGVEYPFQAEEIQDKVKDTFMQKYGTDKIGAVPEVQAKIRSSILKKYGKHHLSTPEIRERIKSTSIEKYGYPCSLQNEEVAEKSRETRIKNDSFKTSKPEKKVREFVQELLPNVALEQNVRTLIPPYEVDIVIPSLKIGIEYGGLYWHSEACIDNNRHYTKYKRCLDVGYRLITIFENEWYDKRSAVLSRLRALLGANTLSIGARDTICSAATKEDVYPFLNEFHLQGSAPFLQAYKLTTTKDNLIVAVMTFAKHHRQTGKEAIVLNRYCVRDSYTIHGGASKLLKFANIKDTLVSYSDNRWSQGELYRHLGFNRDRDLPPDYMYTNNKGVYSKQSMKKSKEEQKLNVTEHELRLSQGYLRVYDCGKVRWVKPYTP